MSIFNISFLGVRGSIAVEGDEYKEFGGATSSVLVRQNDTTIVLDAGTGFNQLKELIPNINNLHLLISHTHIDHIIGLLSNKLLYDSNFKMKVYGKKYEGLTIREQIDKMMTPPLWPVSTSSFKAEIEYIDIEEDFFIDDVKVMIAEGCHPNEALVYKLECQGKSLVYATDYEIDDLSKDRLLKFSENADLLICDGQYSALELPFKKGFGHSCWEQAVSLAGEAKVKELYIFHHDPNRTDIELIKAERSVDSKNVRFARKGGRVSL